MSSSRNTQKFLSLCKEKDQWCLLSRKFIAFKAIGNENQNNWQLLISRKTMFYIPHTWKCGVIQSLIRKRDDGQQKFLRTNQLSTELIWVSKIISQSALDIKRHQKPRTDSNRKMWVQQQRILGLKSRIPIKEPMQLYWLPTYRVQLKGQQTQIKPPSCYGNIALYVKLQIFLPVIYTYT